MQRGQVLVELDATEPQADEASLLEQLAEAVSEERRTQALSQALMRATAGPPVGPRSPEPALPPPAPDTQPAGLERAADGDGPSEASVRRQLRAEWQDITAQLDKLEAQTAHRRAEIATVEQEIAKLQATLPLARQREADYQRLAAQGFMSSHAEQDRARERIEQERDLATQQARLEEAQAALAEAQHERSAYRADTLRQLSERHAQARLKRQQLMQERSKTELRNRLMQLRSPVTGTVQQVAVHTEGGVVTPAQVLMVIVPRDAPVTAQVDVDNQDIGFVHAGQGAQIKLETFPYTRYGTVPARVQTVSADAVHDDKRGAIFPATLTLDRSSIDVEGQRIRISPGMNVTAEVKTGRRRVIDYLLDPLKQRTGDSLRER